MKAKAGTCSRFKLESVNNIPQSDGLGLVLNGRFRMAEHSSSPNCKYTWDVGKGKSLGAIYLYQGRRQRFTSSVAVRTSELCWIQPYLYTTLSLIEPRVGLSLSKEIAESALSFANARDRSESRRFGSHFRTIAVL